MKKSRFGIGLAVVVLLSNLILSPGGLALAQTARSSAPKAVSTEVVNINQATLEDFQHIKGIGPVLAERIVSYRDANGKFKSLEQIKEVKGIGGAKFEKIKSQITV